MGTCPYRDGLRTVERSVPFAIEWDFAKADAAAPGYMDGLESSTWETREDVCRSFEDWEFQSFGIRVVEVPPIVRSLLN